MKDYKFIGEAVDRLVTVPMSNWTILKGLPLTETYEAARKKGGGDPMTLRAAQLLNERVGKGDTVLLLSGFVILNWNRPETDGPVGVAALARSLDLALGAVPVILTEDILVDNLAKTQFQGALRLFPVPESGWRPNVYTCSAVAATGLEEVWKGVEEFLDHIQANGYFRHNRNRQNKYWMYESINEVLRNSFYHDPAVETRIAEYEKRVLEDKISSFIAAKELLDIYFKDLK